MPEEKMWQKFFNPDNVLKTLGIGNGVVNAADFGCGYGIFTIPAAKIISGKIYAIDIEPEMIKVTQRKARENKLNNVETMLRDVMAEGSGLQNESVDYRRMRIHRQPLHQTAHGTQPQG
jgi:ribosomal protein L11 methylase PrmA